MSYNTIFFRLILLRRVSYIFPLQHYLLYSCHNYTRSKRVYTFHPVHLIPFLRVMQLFREKKRKGNLSLRFLKLATSILDEVFLNDFRVASQIRGQKEATTLHRCVLCPCFRNNAWSRRGTPHLSTRRFFPGSRET